MDLNEVLEQGFSKVSGRAFYLRELSCLISCCSDAAGARWTIPEVQQGHRGGAALRTCFWRGECSARAATTNL